MLFSEPKISQYQRHSSVPHAVACFSALQRAENFSMFFNRKIDYLCLEFQCSSASRKFLNRRRCAARSTLSPVSVLFSEPKISQSCRSRRSSSTPATFQCSSASRKFLNWATRSTPTLRRCVSVLFSEPKISQSARRTRTCRCPPVSVLFSEPKISQSSRTRERR